MEHQEPQGKAVSLTLLPPCLTLLCAPLVCLSTLNNPCIFPFTYNNQTHTGCTNAGSENGAAWCATEVLRLSTALVACPATCHVLCCGLVTCLCPRLIAAARWSSTSGRTASPAAPGTSTSTRSDIFDHPKSTTETIILCLFKDWIDIIKTMYSTRYFKQV